MPSSAISAPGWVRCCRKDRPIFGRGRHGRRSRCGTDFLPLILILFMGIAIWKWRLHGAKAAFLLDRLMRAVSLREIVHSVAPQVRLHGTGLMRRARSTIRVTAW